MIALKNLSPSDNCAGQQKNLAMLSIISKFIETSSHVKQVSINFLMTGHSVMTADSMHRVIERTVSKKTVYAPSEWLTIIANARYEPFPYYVIKLDYTDFSDWKAVADSMNISVEIKITTVSENITAEPKKKKEKFHRFEKQN